MGLPDFFQVGVLFSSCCTFCQDVDAADDVDRSPANDLRCFWKNLTSDDVEDDCQVHDDGEWKTGRLEKWIIL